MARSRLNPSLRFYTIPAEIASWVDDWLVRLKLDCVVIDGPLTSNIHRIRWSDEQGKRGIKVEVCGQVFLSRNEINIDVPTSGHVPFENDDLLVIIVPFFGENELRPGAIGSTATDAPSVKLFTAIVDELISATDKGVWFSVGEGQPFLEKSIRYSAGAKSAFKSGVRLLGSGESVVRWLGMELDSGETKGTS